MIREGGKPELTRAATAFAPATVGNAGVGFDLLGFSFGVVGDRVKVEISDRPGVVDIVDITVRGPAAASAGPGAATQFPRDPARNTAGVPLLEMISSLGLRHGFRVWIEKGIPLGSGMGGSAASAVAAVVAANSLLSQPLSKEAQLAFALKGEAVASGSAHADNAAPCLWGGLTLALESGAVVPLPIPAGIHGTLAHPHVVVETKMARALLKPTLGLKDHVRQSGHLAGFIAACFRSDLKLLRESLIDTLIEPQRSILIPGFDDAKRAALGAGALGFSISGSGPSVFAWSASAADAAKVQAAIEAVFARVGVACDAWSAPLGAEGARVVA